MASHGNRSLGSLQRQEKKLAQLLAEMREKREAEVKSHAAIKAKYTKEFEVVRRHPGKRLEQRSNELQQLIAKNREQLSLSEQLLASRHVKVKPSETESPRMNGVASRKRINFYKINRKLWWNAINACDVTRLLFGAKRGVFSCWPRSLELLQALVCGE